MALMLLVSVLLLWPVSSRAAEEPVIKVGVADVAPFGFDCVKGSHADWWRALAQRSGVTISLQLLPLRRLRQALNRGVIDLAIYGPAPHPQSGVADLFFHQQVFFSLYKSRDLLAEGTGLKGKVVGALRGATGIETLAREQQFAFYPLSSYANGIAMLAHGRIDALYGIERGVTYTYRTRSAQELGQSFVLPPPVPVRSYSNLVRASSAFAARHPELIARILAFGQELPPLDHQEALTDLYDLTFN
ncbi:hypothetical protein ACTL6U_07830 [Rhodovibrionaceae bacterium A322]